MIAYYDWVNANGGIGPEGLQVELILKDDAYVASQTQELVADDAGRRPFLITVVGSPNEFAVRQTLNDSYVPNRWALTRHQAWGDPEHYPFTNGLLFSYASEALLWGAYIEQNFDEPVMVPRPPTFAWV